MDFRFFDSDDNVLFVRDDAESANWTVEELNLQCLFPFDPDKEILRGMRIGFEDFEGTAQVFEIRQVKTYEPDHYQEVTAEHIVISELSDEFFSGTEWENVTAQTALAEMLTGTQWAVGTVEASGTSSGSAGMGNVWQNLKTIQDNWNVYLIPRVTTNAAGITGRYIDIKPYGGIWRGVRLSLDKNADEIGVTWDDTKVKTALYGFGGLVDAENEEDRKPLTFAEVTWSATAEHPAKPLNQEYIEDPDAKQAYGRGTPRRNRFGYYQNADITDPEILLQKTWEVLKTVNVPEVSIDCQVRDLYRLGYADEPIRLHDTALIEIRPTGVVLQKEIIRLTVDLIDPTATRATIGAYIPNIVYINKQTNDSATGGGGGSGSKAQGAMEPKEFETFIGWNDFTIDLNAVQYAAAGSAEILRKAGMSINAQGVLVYADDVPNMIQSKLNVQAGRIDIVIDQGGNVKAGVIIDAANQQLSGQSSVKILADIIDIDGLLRAQAVQTAFANIDHIVGNLEVDGGLTVGGVLEVDAIDSDGYRFIPKYTTVVTGVTLNGDGAHDFVWLDNQQMSHTQNGRVVISVQTDTLHYLGEQVSN